MEFRFENPAPRSRHSQTRELEASYALVLRENPGEWARVAERKNINQAGSLAAMIKNGKRAAYRVPDGEGKFETTTRTVDGIGVVYARFVPNTEG